MWRWLPPSIMWVPEITLRLGGKPLDALSRLASLMLVGFVAAGSRVPFSAIHSALPPSSPPSLTSFLVVLGMEPRTHFTTELSFHPLIFVVIKYY